MANNERGGRSGDADRLVALVIDSALRELQLAPEGELAQALHRECIRVLEQLWDRRRALTRVLIRGYRQHAHAPRDDISAADCALALRITAKLISPEQCVQEALVRIGAQRLPGCFLEVTQRPVVEAAVAGSSLPPASEALAAASAEDFLEKVRPGAWFRMYLFDQWATVLVTWRSDNGRSFMFSSRLGGRAHAMSREIVRRMFEDGLVEPLRARKA